MPLDTNPACSTVNPVKQFCLPSQDAQLRRLCLSHTFLSTVSH